VWDLQVEPCRRVAQSIGYGRPVGLFVRTPGNRRVGCELEELLSGRGFQSPLACPPVEVTALSDPFIRMSENLAAAVDARERQAL